MSDNTRRSRRALLAAAAGGAAAVAAQAAVPLTAHGHDVDDVRLGGVNAATAATEIDATGTTVDAFVATAADGSGIVATGTNNSAIRAHQTDALDAAVHAVAGDGLLALAPSETPATGVYAFAPASADPASLGTGLWGDSEDAGVLGTGGLGVWGVGNFGVEGDGYGTGGVGVFGYAGQAGTVGVQAFAGSTDRVALKVTGKAQFTRSGRATISGGASSKAISLAGVTTSSIVFAVLASNRSGRWVRAVVTAAGKFTIYLNTSVTSASYVFWWVLN
jgi:hypothetical protein